MIDSVTFNISRLLLQTDVKEENGKEEADVDGDKQEVVKVKQEVVEVKQEVVEVKQEVSADSATVQVKQEPEDGPGDSQPTVAKGKDGANRGRLVMTVAGEQKILHFDPSDIISTATMMVGDKVSLSTRSAVGSCPKRSVDFSSGAWNLLRHHRLHSG